jgi:ribosome-associated protein
VAQVADNDLQVLPGLEIPMSELTWRFSSSGGPGGQNVNTSNTRVELRLELEGSRALSEEQRQLLIGRYGPVLRVVVSDERSQLRNRQLALARLAATIREGLAVQVSRRPTRATKASQRRRVEAKRRLSTTKQGRRDARRFPDDG